MAAGSLGFLSRSFNALFNSYIRTTACDFFCTQLVPFATNSAYCEESVSSVQTGEQFQFERHGYYIVDPESNFDEIIFNRTATLRDTWQK